MQNLSYENEFCMQSYFMQINAIFMDKNGFTLRLSLKQRHQGTWKWPIESKMTEKWRVDRKV